MTLDRGASITAEQCAVVEKVKSVCLLSSLRFQLLFSWPLSHVGSGLHFVRMMALQRDARSTSFLRTDGKGAALNRLLSLLPAVVSRLCTIIGEADKPVTALLAVRALANFFGSTLESSALSKAESIIETTTAAVKSVRATVSALTVL